MLVASAEVRDADRIGSHQPFVGGADERVGADTLKIERHHPHGLRAVQDECRSHLARPLRDALQVESSSVRPMHVTERHHGRVPVDRVQDRFVPRPCPSRAGHGRADHFEAGVRGVAEPAPCVNVRRELVVDRDHVLPSRQRSVTSGGRKAIGRGRDDGDAGGIGCVHELREELAHAVATGEKICGTDLRRHGAASDGRLPCRLHAPRERRHVGAVEVVVVGRQSKLTLPTT